MNNLLAIAGAGLSAAQTGLAVSAGNIANNSTPGYGLRVSDTVSLPEETVRPAGTVLGHQVLSPSLGYVGGALVTSNVPTFSDSSVPSSVPTHMAINGPGFFAVQQANGTVAYTRAGTFQIDSQGMLVLPSGERLVPPVQLPNGATLDVSPTGVITAVWSSGVKQNIGQISLAQFTNPEGLRSIGGGLYLPSANSGQPTLSRPGQAGAGTLVSGALNASGVNLGTELVNVLQAENAYQLNAKVLQVDQTVMSGITGLHV